MDAAPFAPVGPVGEVPVGPVTTDAAPVGPVGPEPMGPVLRPMRPVLSTTRFPTGERVATRLFKITLPADISLKIAFLATLPPLVEVLVVLVSRIMFPKLIFFIITIF
jgi:hypothetical protein